MFDLVILANECARLTLPATARQTVFIRFHDRIGKNMMPGLRGCEWCSSRYVLLCADPLEKGTQNGQYVRIHSQPGVCHGRREAPVG